MNLLYSAKLKWANYQFKRKKLKKLMQFDIDEMLNWHSDAELNSISNKNLIQIIRFLIGRDGISEVLIKKHSSKLHKPAIQLIAFFQSISKSNPSEYSVNERIELAIRLVDKAGKFLPTSILNAFFSLPDTVCYQETNKVRIESPSGCSGFDSFEINNLPKKATLTPLKSLVAQHTCAKS